ncbi:MAG: type II secretion system GspH family protein [Deltaproteobacteria bacterium]|nr:type II secretion system GspH family protein [Deltaproteobacteria bacterium]
MISIASLNNPDATYRHRIKSQGLHLQNSGFTLIELIVVISLFGLMLFFSLPRLQDNPFLDDSKESARWLIGKVQVLKENAIRDQKQYTLFFDLDSGRVWEANESMSPEEFESAALNSKALPDDIRIIDVEYPTKGKIDSGLAEIAFYKAGYTDKALVHMQEGDTYLSFLIEPFLSSVQFFDIYASFED